MKRITAVFINIIVICCLSTSCVSRNRPDSSVTESSQSMIIADDFSLRYRSTDELLEDIQKGGSYFNSATDEIDGLLVIEPGDGYAVYEIVTFGIDSYEYWLHPITCNGRYPGCSCELRIFVVVSRIWESFHDPLREYYFSEDTAPLTDKSSTYTKRHAAGRDVLLESANKIKHFRAIWFYEGHDITVSYDVASGVEAPDLTQEGELEKLVGAIAACRLIPMEDIRAHGSRAAAE